VRSGEGREEVFGNLPAPPAIPTADEALAARATWYALLDGDVTDILETVVPPGPKAPVPAGGEVLHAAG